MFKNSILVTNDDGIFAEGIQVLSQKIFEAYSQELGISIVAPDHEQSAVGHAITMHRPLRVEPVRYLHNPELAAWSVNGTPSDCVKLAVESLLPERPSLVISGINQGSNLGTDIFYSGTVSAAVEGVILGIPSIAISLVKPDESGFEFSARFACRLIPLLIETSLPPGTLLNINVPPGTGNKIKGARVTRLGDRRYRNTFQKRTDPRGKHYYWLAGDVIETQNEEEFDVGASKEGYISITPIHFDLTRYDLFETLQKTIDRIDLFAKNERVDTEI